MPGPAAGGMGVAPPFGGHPIAHPHQHSSQTMNFNQSNFNQPKGYPMPGLSQTAPFGGRQGPSNQPTSQTPTMYPQLPTSQQGNRVGGPMGYPPQNSYQSVNQSGYVGPLGQASSPPSQPAPPPNYKSNTTTNYQTNSTPNYQSNVAPNYQSNSYPNYQSNPPSNYQSNAPQPNQSNQVSQYPPGSSQPPASAYPPGPAQQPTSSYPPSVQQQSATNQATNQQVPPPGSSFQQAPASSYPNQNQAYQTAINQSNASPHYQSNASIRQPSSLANPRPTVSASEGAPNGWGHQATQNAPMGALSVAPPSPDREAGAVHAMHRRFEDLQHEMQHAQNLHKSEKNELLLVVNEKDNMIRHLQVQVEQLRQELAARQQAPILVPSGGPHMSDASPTQQPPLQHGGGGGQQQLPPQYPQSQDNQYQEPQEQSYDDGQQPRYREYSTALNQEEKTVKNEPIKRQGNRHEDDPPPLPQSRRSVGAKLNESRLDDERSPKGRGKSRVKVTSSAKSYDSLDGRPSSAMKSRSGSRTGFGSRPPSHGGSAAIDRRRSSAGAFSNRSATKTFSRKASTVTSNRETPPDPLTIRAEQRLDDIGFYTAINDADQIDVMLEEGMARLGCAVPLRRVNQGYYRLGSPSILMVGLEVKNGKLLASVPSWNNDRPGSFDNWLRWARGRALAQVKKQIKAEDAQNETLGETLGESVQNESVYESFADGQQPAGATLTG